MTGNSFEIRIDDLTGPEIHALLDEHLAGMRAISPPESVHALDLDRLRKPEITFWTVWSQGPSPQLLGCGALKQIDPAHGEVKSMRTAKAYLRKGVARAVLRHIIEEATRREYHRLSLETGSQDEFQAAHQLYESFGFTYCPPFGEYRDDPNSVFMTKVLDR